MSYPKRISRRSDRVMGQNRALKQWVEACLPASVLRHDIVQYLGRNAHLSCRPLHGKALVKALFQHLSWMWWGVHALIMAAHGTTPHCSTKRCPAELERH